jgi:phosphate transport system substrate-binding protein
MGGSVSLARILWFGGVIALAFAAGAAAMPPRAEASVTVLGAGSTWDQIATTQFAADVHSLYGITINYQGVGSTAGRQFYISSQVDFGDSDIPFLPSELVQLHKVHKTFQYLPTVAGGTAAMYNLRTPSGKQIRNLQLDSRALTGIFTGTIRKWNDPIITSQNPQLRGQIPNAPVVPVVRADGSGTSAMFSDYLRQLQPAMWRRFCSAYQISPCGQISFWPLNIPGAIAQKGSDGVANFVQQQTNTITYVETGYAIARGFPVAYVKNQSGHYVYPSSQNDATALTHARIQPDLISDLTGVHTAPEANAYPIAGYSYMITPTKAQYGFTTAKGAVLGKFILYMACAGQQKAASLGYSPLTPVLVKGVFAAVRRIPGAPAPPPLSKCNNPTLHGGGSGGGLSGNTPGGSPSSHHSSSGHHHHGKKTKAAQQSASGGSTPATAGVTPAAGVQLTAAQLVARRALALKTLGSVTGASTTPMLLAILDILVIALCPWIIWHHRSHRPEAAPPPAKEDST